MTFDEYQQTVAYRFASSFSTVDALMVAVSGILIELDEVGRATNKAEEHEELGDTLFYIAYAENLNPIDPFYNNGRVSLSHVYSSLLQALGMIHKCKRGTRLLDDKAQAWIAYSISIAYRWVEQQGVDMDSLYKANIKKVSGL